jgi:hypothetical protein
MFGFGVSKTPDFPQQLGQGRKPDHFDFEVHV